MKKKNVINNTNPFLINGINISHNPYDHILVALYSYEPSLELQIQLEAYGVFPNDSTRRQRKNTVKAYLLFNKMSLESNPLTVESNNVKRKVR